MDVTGTARAPDGRRPVLRVLVADPIDRSGIERLQQDEAVEVDVRPGLDRALLLARIREFDGLVVRSETRVNEELLSAASRLTVVGRAGVGVDNIDLEAATRRGVIVVNTPEATTTAVAEHTMALLLALARRIPQAHQALSGEGRWDRRAFMGVQLAGKRLGLIGLGRIGMEVARRAQAFGMHVVGYDPYVRPERAGQAGVELVAELDELLRQSDVVSLHVPLTPHTRGLIGAAQLAMMKPGSFLVNCARGGIVDEAALAEALARGHLGGAALDVYAEEPLRTSPLLGLPQVVLTPHLGASTRESQSGAALQVAEDVLRALKGEFPHHAVNLPSIPPERWPWARPYLDLARRLGRLYTELFGAHALARLEVVYRGELARAPETPALTAAALWGVLGPVLQEGVSLANAMMLARARGMEVTESHGEGTPSGDGDNGPTLILRARGLPAGERQLGGKVGPSDRRPRLVMMDGYRLHIDQPGYLLVSAHQDKPGIIGQVGTMLGRHGINIAYMQVGRESPGGHAVMVVGVDAPVPAPVLAALRAIPDLWDLQQGLW